MNIALLEIYAGGPNAGLPNLAYGLFKHDLEKRGHNCDILRVSYNVAHSTEEAYRLYKHILSENYDLIGLNSFSALTWGKLIKNVVTDCKIIVGGENSIMHMNELDNGKIDFICHGAGRETMRMIADALENKIGFDEVPNLIYKKNGKIVHSKVFKKFDLKTETEDFWPDYDALYFGLEPDNITKVSIIAEFGCPYRRSVEQNPFFKDVKFFFDFDLSKCDEEVKKIIETHIEDVKKGCSFCEISSDRGYTPFNKKEKVESLMQQIKNMESIYGEDIIFELLSEAPLTFLEELVEELEREEIKAKIALSSRIDHLLYNKQRMENIAKKLNKVVLIFGLFGLENFSDKELMIYNKGITAKQNIEGMEYVNTLLKRYPKNIMCNGHFTLIPYNPWTTIEDLKKNLAVFEKEEFQKFISASPLTRTLFIPKDNALYFKALKDGVLDDCLDISGGIAWHFIDKRVEGVYMNYYKKLTPNTTIKERVGILKKELERFD